MSLVLFYFKMLHFISSFYFLIALSQKSSSGRTKRNFFWCPCFRWDRDCRCSGKPVRWRSALGAFRTLNPDPSTRTPSCLPHRVPVSDPSYGGRQTEPGAGVPGGPGPVPRPGPGREGARLAVAGRAAEIGERAGGRGPGGRRSLRVFGDLCEADLRVLPV